MEKITLVYDQDDLILFIEHYKESYEHFPSIQNIELVCMQMAKKKYPEYEFEQTEIDERALSVKFTLVKAKA